MKRSVVTAALALTLVAAGCGSDTSESTTSVEQIQSFADQQLQLRLEQNQNASPFDCEEHDGGKWECVSDVTTTTANGDTETAELTVNVTCEAASCTYAPET